MSLLWSARVIASIAAAIPMLQAMQVDLPDDLRRMIQGPAGGALAAFGAAFAATGDLKATAMAVVVSSLVVAHFRALERSRQDEQE